MRASRRLAAGAFALAACGRIGFDGQLTPEVAESASAALSVGRTVSCAIRDGDVYCWGQGEEGQIGPDGPLIATRPMRVTTIPKATKIAAALYHVCMLGEAGDVWCWGGNEYGRIGVPPPQQLLALPGGPRTDPLRVDLPGPAIDIAVSDGSTCAVLATGAVWCWGRNGAGQLGRGVTSADDAVNLPAAVMNISNARRISIDDDSACALRADQTIACWGENGRGLIDASQMARTIATPVDGFAGVTAIAVGGDHLCAVIDGRVGCRGAGTSGELGNGEVEDSTDVVYSTLDDAIEIEAGASHTCVVRATGAAACWGDNELTLGDGTFEARSTPTQVVGLDDAIAISTGEYSTCAARASGAVTCWGYGARGLLGDGRSAETSARPVPTLANAAYVAVGRDHSCISDTSDVACWGSNRRGQLGTGGGPESVATPQVLSFTWPFGIAQLVAGEMFTCARLADATVYCWGHNSAGQLGLGTFTDETMPVLVASLPPTAELAAGREHACALGTDRAVRCWGHNESGQVGDGTLVTRESPVMVAVDIDQIAIGDAHTCARQGTSVACWGNNGAGQLGDGTQTMRLTSTPVTGLVAGAIVAGGNSTCAERAGGVACWGLNDSNVLDAPAAMYYQPTPIDSMQTTLFALGGRTACGGSTCWGANEVGQVGAGDLGYHGAPTTVMGLPSTTRTFAISYTHTCAVINGATYCWGENASGEIGVGTTSSASFAATTVAFP